MIRPATDGITVFLCVQPVDFRKQANGLSMLVESVLSLDPLSSAVFAFTNRRRNQVKLLVWETNGFVLWQKRLEEHRFKWPKLPEQVLTINRKQLSWLIAGLDFSTAHQRLYYQHVS